MSEIPEYSTFGQTLQAFRKSFTTEAFLNFAKQHKIDAQPIKIDPLTNNLHCRVKGANGWSTNKVFNVSDSSGWSTLAPAIGTLARSLTAGSTSMVSPDEDARIEGSWISNFYSEQAATNDTLAATLTQSSRLLRYGFRALNIDNPPTDKYSRNVQAKQRAVIQTLENVRAPQADMPAQSTEQPVLSINPLADITRLQFAAEPNLRSVVGRLLSDKIKEAYPAQDIDIQQIAIETPDADNPGTFKRTPLMELALNRLADGDTPTFTSADRAVDTRPEKGPNTHLSIDWPALHTFIDTLGNQVNQAFDAESREYWDTPTFSTPNNAGTVFPGSRRTLLSHILRSNLQLASLKQAGLDDEQRKTVDMVVRHPDGSTRPAPLDPRTSGATVYTLSGSTSNMVISRYLQQSHRDILLLVEPNGKITPYASWEELRTAGHTRMELTGDMFDAQAEALIKQHQGDSLINQPLPLGTADPALTDTKLPDWLNNAGEAERFVMHELSLGLASFTQLNKGSAYNSDIADIHAFAQQQFDLLPESQKLTPHAAKNLEVVFKVPYGTIASGFIDRQTMSLTDVLLNNLSGLPNGQVEVFFKTGFRDQDGAEIKVRVPALEKDGVLRTLVEDLDIGKTYPALIKQALLDDPVKKAERQSLFAQQVPLELKLQALELKIKGESGFNATGFQYVQEILKPGPGPKTVQGKEIVIRPLAFDNKANGKVDVVESAYLIEPRDSMTGPHILYRPLISDAPLLQFPSRQALLEAIQKPGKLQNDTLAWLPDETTRSLYRGDGFTHPNLVIFGYNLGSVSLNETIPLAVDTRLQQTLQEGKLMEYLYEANAQSLITLAEHQSTSDAKSRWESLKTGGFLLLNAALPFLGGPAAKIGQLLVGVGIINDVKTLLDADAKGKEAALTDLLVNLTAQLLHFKTRPTRTLTGATNSGSVLVEEPVTLAAPPKSRIVLGGPTAIKPLAGDIQVFVDSYNGEQRLNIMGHGEKPIGDQPAHIFGEDGTQYTAEDIDRELLARGINIRDYRDVRLLACYSGSGGQDSLAGKLNALTGARVKGFEQEIITEYNGIDDKDPFKIYENAQASYRQRYPNFSDGDIQLLAENKLNRTLAGRHIDFNVNKETGTEIELNIGSDEKPVIYRTKVDYQPRTYGAPKAKPAPAKPVEVLMGYSHTVEDSHTVLSTRSLTDCSALAVLTDLKDGVYQKRTLMHLTGSNLEFGLLDKDTYRELAELDESLANGGKVIFVGGVDSQSPVGMGVVLGQEYRGKKPLLDMLKKPGVDVTIASSVGVDIKSDGTFTLIDGTGKGVFTKPMINDVFDFAD